MRSAFAAAVASSGRRRPIDNRQTTATIVSLNGDFAEFVAERAKVDDGLNAVSGSASPGDWLRYDFGAVIEIEEYQLLGAGHFNSATNFTAYHSNDASSWTAIQTQACGAGPSDLTTVPAGVQARYLKLHSSGNSGAPYLDCWRVKGSP